MYVPFSQVVCIGKVDGRVNLENENPGNVVSNWVLINASVNHGVGNIA